MKTKWKVSFLLVILILSYLTFWNYKNRIYDWDMPGYLGCLYTSRFPDSPEKVRNLTFGFIEKEAPADQYNDIIGLKPVDRARQVFKNDTQSFTEQIPYFQIKAGYNLAISFFYEIGFSPPMAVLVASLISYFISGLLLFYIVTIIFPQKYLIAAGLTIVIALLPPMTYMSRVSTPDMFIFQFLLVFAIGWIKRWNKWIMFLILLGITFTRPDYIPFTLSYLISVIVFEYYKDKKIDFYILIQGAALLCLYMFIIKFYNYPGWKNLFYDSFIYRRPTISAQPAVFTIEEYLHILLNKIIYFKKVSLISLSMLGAVFYLSKDQWVKLSACLIFANIYIKFIFFPHSSGLRFFFGFIILLFIILLYALSKKYNGFKLNKIV